MTNFGISEISKVYEAYVLSKYLMQYQMELARLYLIPKDVWDGTVAPDKPVEDFTLEKVTETITAIKQVGPFVRAVWFVDTPIASTGLLELAIQRDWIDMVKYDKNLMQFPRFNGIPLHEFWNKDATKEQYEAFPWFVRCRGIWLEMSDGKHKLLDLEAK